MRPTSITLVSQLFALSLAAQGTLYLSNIGESTSDSFPIASDSWAAAAFQTGENYPGGYLLNSIQLLMGGGSGSPSGFSISIYVPNRTELRGTLIGSLNGVNPSSSGVFAFTPVSEIHLLPLFSYEVVATADTSSTEGFYAWNRTTSHNYSTANWPGSYGSSVSIDGTSWTSTTPSYLFQFAVYATPLPVPEPSCPSLLGLGGFLLAGYIARSRAKRMG